MNITILTLFPDVFTQIFSHSILKRAQSEKLLSFKFVNIRDFGIGQHQVVDDKPYGGGVGMVLRVDVLDAAVQSVKTGEPSERTILMDPRGVQYTQSVAEELSTLTHLILVCGHYEGFDDRITQLVDMSISIGDYVLSGGEIAAMVVSESVARLIPGVLKKEPATELESFSHIDQHRVLEYPQFTRPPEYKGLTVPDELLTGNHKQIEEYRKKEALRITQKLRPDLLDQKGD